MRLLVTAALLALAAACAPANQLSAKDLLVGFEQERPAARTRIRESDAPAFLARAAGVLKDEGLKIAARTRMQVVTEPRDLDFRCGQFICRARELTMVNVSGGLVRVEIVRAVRGPANPNWHMALGEEMTQETALREVRLLEAMVGRGAAISLR
jgi:hypothetical protein